MIEERFGAEILFILVFSWRQNALYCAIALSAFLLLCSLSVMFCYVRTKQMRSSMDTEFVKRSGLDNGEAHTISMTNNRKVSFMETSMNGLPRLRRITSNVDEVKEGGEISIGDYMKQITTDIREQDEGGDVTPSSPGLSPMVNTIVNGTETPTPQKLTRQKRKREIAMENFFRSITPGHKTEERKELLKGVDSGQSSGSTHSTPVPTHPDDFTAKRHDSSRASHDQGYSSELMNEKRVVTTFPARHEETVKDVEATTETTATDQSPRKKDRYKKKGNKKSKDKCSSKFHLRLEKTNSGFSDDTIPVTGDEKVDEELSGMSLSHQLQTPDPAEGGYTNETELNGMSTASHKQATETEEEAPYFPPDNARETPQMNQER